MYYVWGIFLFIFSRTHPLIQKIFFIYNNPYLMNKRSFKFLSYFEKLFLVLFYRRGWFERSLAYLNRKKDIEDYRRDKYPLIHLFHLYLDKSDYKFESLHVLANQYNFFYKSPLFRYKFKILYNYCFYFITNKFLKFLIIQNVFMRNYWNTWSSFFFKEQDVNNTYTLNFVFFTFLLKSKYRFVVYNLNHWKDWYEFSTNDKIIKCYKIKPKSINYDKNEIKGLKFIKLMILIRTYKIRYMVFSRLLKKDFVNMIFFRFSFANFFKLRIKKEYNKWLTRYYLIRFSESSVSKHINSNFLHNYSFSYLRKNRIFNKGRYSRNRQLYRTGVYWCLWLNIIMVYGLYFLFYRFSFNFGYIWWGILVLAYSTIFSRIVKYNFFNPFYVYKEFLSLQRWYGYVIKNTFNTFENYMKKYFLSANLYDYVYKYTNSRLNIFYSRYYYHFSKLYFYWLKKKQNTRIVYLWQGMKEIDKSFLRYKTILHWIKEIFRMFTTW